MDRDHDRPAAPPPLPAAHRRPAGGRRRSFWRTPLGILVAIGLVLSALVLAALVAIGVGIQIGYVPDSAALPGDRLQTRVVDILRDADILEPGEQVRYYYSAGLFDFLEDGNLYTDRRVISYWQADGELQVGSAIYAEIEDISVAWSQSWIDDTEITVRLADGGELLLLVSPEKGGDKKFHAGLERVWEEHR